MKKVIVLVLSALLVACATGSGKKPAAVKPVEKQASRHKAQKPAADTSRKSSRNKELLAEKNPSPNVTLSLPESTLGEFVLNLSESVGGSLVLMNGIENRSLAPVAFKAEKFSSVVSQLSALTSTKVQEYPSYSFLYPEGYETVLDISFAGKLDPAFADKEAGMAFGPDTPLYAALALVGDTLGVTLVADNIVAEAKCGALSLARIPLQDGLEALLKSARIPPAAFQVESTPEYIFIYAAQNATPPSALLNPDGLTPEQNALLDKVVDVTLPAPPPDPEHRTIVLGATPLAKVLGVLSESLGVKVANEPGLDELPVNPCVLRKVRVRTAMDLIIRQWFQPEFGYSVTGDGLLIERRK